ncbi:MAG: polymorphic toxin type 44 domain-containing protein [Bacteroidales bacterium]
MNSKPYKVIDKAVFKDSLWVEVRTRNVMPGEEVTIKIEDKDNPNDLPIYVNVTVDIEGKALVKLEGFSSTVSNHCNHPDGAIEVAKYIVDEIKKNTKSNIASTIRYYASEEEYRKRYEEWLEKNFIQQALLPLQTPDPIKARLYWTRQVFKNMPWDHKPKIRDKFKHLAVERVEYSNRTKKMVTYKSYYHKYKDYDYFYDVWSNIHFGYVGLSVGFDEDTLLGGADMAQVFDSGGNNSLDTPDDKTSIKIGFSLFYKYGVYAEKLSKEDVLEFLDSAKMEESKKKHKCSN